MSCKRQWIFAEVCTIERQRIFTGTGTVKKRRIGDRTGTVKRQRIGAETDTVKYVGIRAWLLPLSFPVIGVAKPQEPLLTTESTPTESEKNYGRYYNYNI